MSVFPRVGLSLPTSVGAREATWPDVREAALIADRAGIDSVWYPDHFFLRRAGERIGVLECWTAMTALAALTSSVRIGSLVLCQSFRAPGLLAKAASTLQEIANGRLILGIGAGWFEDEYREFGFHFDKKAGHFEEYVQIVRGLLRGETVTIRGKHHAVESAKLLPSSPPTPVWVASSRPRMNRIAASQADGWNGAWYGRNVGSFRARLDALKDDVRAAGRDPNEIEYSVGIFAVPADDGRDAALNYVRETAPQFAQLDDEALLDRVFVGTTAEIHDLIVQYGDAGANTVIVSFGSGPFGLRSMDGLDGVLTGLAS